jgi:hypothetical protein
LLCPSPLLQLEEVERLVILLAVRKRCLDVSSSTDRETECVLVLQLGMLMASEYKCTLTCTQLMLSELMKVDAIKCKVINLINVCLLNL